MPPHLSYTGQSRQIIYNLYEYFVIERKRYQDSKFNRYFSKVNTRLVEATGITFRTLSTILEDLANKDPGGSEEAALGSKRRATRGLCLLTSISDCDVIREMITELNSSEQSITLSQLKKRLTAVKTSKFRGTKKELARILNEMGYAYYYILGGTSTNKNNKILLEKYEVRLQRIKYLIEMEKHRATGRNFVFISDSFINLNTKRDRYVINRERFVIVHAWSEKDSVPLGFLVRHLSKDIQEYKTWFLNNVIPKLPEKAVIVMNDAVYPKQFYENYPAFEDMSKADMLKLLRFNQVKCDKELTKPELYELIQQNASKYTEKSLDEIIRNAGHTVLRIPSYHPKFDPLFSFWVDIREYIADKFKKIELFDDVEAKILEKIDLITIEEWKTKHEEVAKAETEYKQRETAIDNFTDSLQVQRCNPSEDEMVQVSTDDRDSDMEIED